MSITPKDFRSIGQYKYVRFANDKVVFCVTTDVSQTHRRLVDEYPELIPVSAGKIQVNNGRWNVSEKGSYSAKIGWGADDEDAIQNELGNNFVFDYDMLSY